MSHNSKGVRSVVARRATQTWAPNAELFVQRAGMNPCPDNYANRGACTADLNAQTLEFIRNQIRSHVGLDAEDNYLLMIKEIPYLSAESFLSMLYTLEVAGWRWSSSHLIGKKEFSSRPYSNSIIPGAGSLRDETEYIKKQFFDQLKKTSQVVKIDDYSW